MNHRCATGILRIHPAKPLSLRCLNHRALPPRVKYRQAVAWARGGYRNAVISRRSPQRGPLALYHHFQFTPAMAMHGTHALCTLPSAGSVGLSGSDTPSISVGGSGCSWTDLVGSSCSAAEHERHKDFHV